MTRKRVHIAGVAVVVGTAAVLLVGRPNVSANALQQAATTAEVKIDNFAFGSGTITVAAGTTVTWTNQDDIPHTVVSTDTKFKSKVLDTGEQFSSTFSKPGTYTYFCSVHPKMTGKVVVQ